LIGRHHAEGRAVATPVTRLSQQPPSLGFSLLPQNEGHAALACLLLQTALPIAKYFTIE